MGPDCLCPLRLPVPPLPGRPCVIDRCGSPAPSSRERSRSPAPQEIPLVVGVGSEAPAAPEIIVSIPWNPAEERWGVEHGVPCRTSLVWAAPRRLSCRTEGFRRCPSTGGAGARGHWERLAGGRERAAGSPLKAPGHSPGVSVSRLRPPWSSGWGPWTLESELTCEA